MASRFITSKEEMSSSSSFLSSSSSPSPSALKGLKVGDDEVTDTDEMTESGIAAKIANWNKKITAKEDEIEQKQTEVPTLEGQINTKKSEIDEKQKELDEYEEVNLGTDDSLRQSLKLIKMKDELNQELRKLQDDLSELKDHLSAMERTLSEMKQKLADLKQSFSNGKYFSHLVHYWEEHPVNVATDTGYMDVKWENYQRTIVEAERIKVRKCNKEGDFSDDFPYKVTRNGALNPETVTVSSRIARNSSQSQKDKIIRDLVWPTDIFGNIADDEEIAHLLPGGIQYHKEWMYVAAAVVGIDLNADADSLKKAVRGFKNSTEQPRRVPGTGVVHFNSNKLRMENQAKYYDGDDPSALLIPVMTLTEAKSWQGEAYCALFVMGLPSNGFRAKENPKNYIEVGLSTEDVMKGGAIRDATNAEIETAQVTLIHAVLALRDLLVNMKDEGFAMLGPQQDGLILAQQQFTNLKSQCIVPRSVATSNDRKPLCLVSFGKADEKGKHPPPDPLLLAYKAAVIWSRMTTKMRMLANGEKADVYDDDMSDWDDDSCVNSPSWDELAVGLGQPNGYKLDPVGVN
jgi:hypothetical protein